jgi:hypothetical protein
MVSIGVFNMIAYVTWKNFVLGHSGFGHSREAGVVRLDNPRSMDNPPAPENREMLMELEPKKRSEP